MTPPRPVSLPEPVQDLAKGDWRGACANTCVAALEASNAAGSPVCACVTCSFYLAAHICQADTLAIMPGEPALLAPHAVKPHPKATSSRHVQSPNAMWQCWCAVRDTAAFTIRECTSMTLFPGAGRHWDSRMIRRGAPPPVTIARMATASISPLRVVRSTPSHCRVFPFGSLYCDTRHRGRFSALSQRSVHEKCPELVPVPHLAADAPCCA